MKNPFNPNDHDRFQIWNMLVSRDISAFVDQNWEKVQEDFIKNGFWGIHANKIANPDGWSLAYPDLSTYKNDWLKQAKEFSETSWEGDLTENLHRVTLLGDIEINRNRALVHKKLIGNLRKSNGEEVPTNWQTLYKCRRINNRWKITGFTGYLPLYSNTESSGTQGTSIQLPKSAVQHSTAGPYSPVLEVNPGRMVVISGQAAIDQFGNVVGDTIEEQANVTLENCIKQLSFAGCGLSDVFKVNVYMKDLKDWSRFNEVYQVYFTTPMPVRTAIQSGLLMTLLVEIELWAIKPMEAG